MFQTIKHTLLAFVVVGLTACGSGSKSSNDPVYTEAGSQDNYLSREEEQLATPASYAITLNSIDLKRTKDGSSVSVVGAPLVGKILTVE